MKKFDLKLPSLDSFSSRKNWEEECWKIILSSRESIGNLMTAYERRNIILRVAVLNLLNSGTSYRRIAEELWLSPQTISSIKKTFKESFYRSYRERGKLERKRKTYSLGSSQKKRRPLGRRIKTKYGVIQI